MRIRVDEIAEAGRQLHFHWDDTRLRQFISEEDPFELSLLRPVNVDLDIQKRPDHIHVHGILKGFLQVSCHRCLREFEFRLAETFDVYLMPEREIPEAEELELELRDMEYEFFDGVVIEIDQLVAEQIFLSLPVKVLCSEDCRGLCPRCGTNLNEENCRCSEKENLSPFSRLQAIRSRLPGSADS